MGGLGEAASDLGAVDVAVISVLAAEMAAAAAAIDCCWSRYEARVLVTVLFWGCEAVEAAAAAMKGKAEWCE